MRMPINQKKQGGQSIVGWLVGILVILLLVLVIVPLITGEGVNLFGPGGLEEEPTPEEEITPTLAEEREIIDDITQNPQNYFGRIVTVSSEIQDLVGLRSFMLDSPGILDNDLLVITASAPGQGNINVFGQGNTVRVMGTVREFNLTEVENDLNIDLDDDLFDGRQGDPVVIASSVEVLERTE